MLSPSVIVFVSRCSDKVPNNGVSSANVVTSLPVGHHLIICRPVKLLLAFASTVDPGVSHHEIHEQYFFFSPIHLRVSKWGLLFDEGGVGLSV
jgi:hypothetical protein